ncbi:MAG: hypothetical protein Q9209_005188 [Squamulea sp. 1 TL-2023]
MKVFSSANDIHMRGDTFENTAHIPASLEGFLSLDFGGVDKVELIDIMNAFHVGQAVNQLYRIQKIFVTGGGACGDAGGIIESGPQDQSICRDGRAWYLYNWQENDAVSTTAHE